MVLKEFVYADEAGTHEGATYCLVAGYRASPRQWKEFRKEWPSVLKSANVPEFHANGFFNRKVNKSPRENPYLGWSDAKANEFLQALLDIIHKRQIHPLGCAVDVPAFRALTYGEQRALSGQVAPKGRQAVSPYLFVLAGTLTMAVDGTSTDTEIHFRFGLHPGYKGRGVELFELLRGGPQFAPRAHQLASIAFYPTTAEPGLQAADLYTHAWYNALTRKGHLNQENTKVMNALTRKVPGIPTADAASLERVLDVMPEAREYVRRDPPPRNWQGR